MPLAHRWQRKERHSEMAEDRDKSKDEGTYVRDAQARAQMKERLRERERERAREHADERGHRRIGSAPVAAVDVQTELERLKNLKRRAIVRRVITLCFVVASAFLQAFAIQVFVQPAGLLSSGFTGLAILIDRVTSLFGFSFPTFVGMVVLNVPVAIICWNSISKRFVVFSMIQVFLSSFFLSRCCASRCSSWCSAGSSTVSRSPSPCAAGRQRRAPTSSRSWCPTRPANPSGASSSRGTAWCS